MWVEIMKFLNCTDILSIKCLSKRCYTIAFLNQRFSYFQIFAKRLIDCDFVLSKL